MQEKFNWRLNEVKINIFARVLFYIYNVKIVGVDEKKNNFGRANNETDQGITSI